MIQEFFSDFGKYEVEIERYYDHYLAAYSLLRAMKPLKNRKPALQFGGDEQ